MLLPSVRESVLDLIATPYVFPQDILDEIKADLTAWKNYQNFSDSYKRIRIAYIDAVRHRPLEFQKRLNSFVTKTCRNQLIVGFCGIDKYYNEIK